MLKSALDIAMEKLGDAGPKLTEKKKSALADIDSRYRATIAEHEILFAGRIQAARIAGDADSLSLFTSQLADERSKLEAARNKEKDKVRAGTGR